MRMTLEDLYYGNIAPSEQRMVPGSEMKKAVATHALASGVDVKTLSGILGHTRAAFTLDTYTHTTGDMQKRASEVVGDFLTDIFGEELRPWEESAKAVRVPSV